MYETMTWPLAAAPNPLLVYALFAGALGVVAYAVLNLVSDLKTSDQRKLADRLREGPAPHARDRAAAAREAMIRKRLYGETGAVDQLLGKISIVSHMQRMIDQADLTWTASNVLLGQTVAAIMLVALGILFQLPLAMTIGLPILAMIGPVFYVVWKRNRRRKKIMYQLPDVFELMAQALRAGHGLASAIQVVAQQMPDPIGGEFARVYHEQSLGITIEEALRNMGDRVGILDVRFFVTAVMIQRTTGGDLAEILDKISSVIRGRIELFGTVQALTAEGRLSGYVLLALPILVFFASWNLNPEYAGMLLYDEKGKLLLWTAIGFQVLGYAMIKKIVNVKV